jgi:hypothetical protein
MKVFSKLLMAAVLCLPLSVKAQGAYGIGGFVQPPTVKSAFVTYSVPGVGTNVLAVAAGAPTATNLPATTVANLLTVGRDGFGVHYYGNLGAAASTNVLVFERSGDGVTFPSSPTIDIWVTGTGAVALYTNVASSTANIGNLVAVRLKYITNHASASVANITNITISTR